MSQQAQYSKVSSNDPDGVVNKELPMMVTNNKPEPSKNCKTRKMPRLVVLPLIFLVLFTGAVVGIYVQPPGLKLFMELSSLISARSSCGNADLFGYRELGAT
jgi:hypothetical protein